MEASIDELNVYLPATLRCTLTANAWESVTIIGLSKTEGILPIASFSPDGDQTLSYDTALYSISRATPALATNVFTLQFNRVHCRDNITYICRGVAGGQVFSAQAVPSFTLSQTVQRTQAIVPDPINAGEDTNILCQSLEFLDQAVVQEYSIQGNPFANVTFGTTSFFSTDLNVPGLECVYLSRNLRQFAFPIQANGVQVRCRSLSTDTTSAPLTLNVVQP